MKNVQRSAFNFKLNPIAASIVLAMSSQFVTSAAIAGSGWGAGTYLNAPAVTTPVRTYYANSPAGPVTALDPVTGLSSIDPVTNLTVKVDSGKALRKFVDTLPGIPGITTFTGAMFTVNGTKVVYNPTSQANNLGQYIPVAVPEKWVDTNGNVTNDDYYEIAAVEYTEKMHSDLPKPTRLRGYVQISTATNPGKHIALTYPDGTPILDVNGAQVFAYDNPHHLGPIINSTKGTAVRVKFDQLSALFDRGEPQCRQSVHSRGHHASGRWARAGRRELLHREPRRDPSGRRRSALDQRWFAAPVGRTRPARSGAYAARLSKGVSTQNVPDMADPDKGSTTLYFPNDMSARFMFYRTALPA